MATKIISWPWWVYVNEPNDAENIKEQFKLNHMKLKLLADVYVSDTFAITGTVIIVAYSLYIGAVVITTFSRFAYF